MIETTPPGLSVYVDGENRGPSPVSVKLERNRSHTVMAATNHSSYTRELNPRLSTAGTLDIFGAALLILPGVGLLAPGAWDLEMKTVVLHLDWAPTTLPATPAE